MRIAVHLQANGRKTSVSGRKGRVSGQKHHLSDRKFKLNGRKPTLSGRKTETPLNQLALKMLSFFGESLSFSEE